jgi:hypothetical protein
MAALIDACQDSEILASVFVRAMQLQGINFWHGDAKYVVDYVIDPEHSNQILAVKIGLGDEVLDVAWES